ncbi:MAG TPA: gamma-glutamyltransferase, partial [Chthoniobacteraceae bacterium]|nr:gamma-glutamyltransferase [Chthoniobacteraceae bacterium]
MPRIVWVSAAILLIGNTAFSADKVAQGAKGAAASVNPIASNLGVKVMQEGGNAVDAAVAMGLMLGVVDPHNAGLGGGCFLLIRKPDGLFVALDGRECAPAAATRATFLRDGKADPKLSQIGPLAAGVPGALAAYAEALERFGRKSLKDLIAPAADMAEQGFSLDQADARRLNAHDGDFKQDAGASSIYVRPDRPWQAGDRLKQTDLGATYRAIGLEGATWFYHGAFAEMVGQWMTENGGLMTTQDFTAYRVVEREPVRGKYRGHEIVSFPPPSSGGIHVIQILQMLERFDLKALDPATRAHVIGEAMKIAFADRAHWLGDPDFAPVPRGLIRTDYADELSARILLDRVVPIKTHGDPPNATTDVFKKHTTHFSVADAEGWWVACTATINTPYGAKVVVPGTGLLLNNEMDDFSLEPGAPNFFGLIGAEANAVEPRKRPLSSMSPTIVLHEGRPILALGAAGGPTIITQTVNNLIGVIDLGISIDAALAAPRLHHQWRPDELRIEKDWPEDLRAKLKSIGHSLNVIDSIGASNAVGWKGGTFTAASEPRTASGAAAW